MGPSRKAPLIDQDRSTVFGAGGLRKDDDRHGRLFAEFIFVVPKRYRGVQPMVWDWVRII